MRQKIVLPLPMCLVIFQSMQPRTEEFLYLLLWSTEKLMWPTFRNLTDSYESWAYRNGLLRQTIRLESEKISGTRPRCAQRPHVSPHLAGTAARLGGRDPQARWSREWDGRWRLVLFDVPTAQELPSHAAATLFAGQRLRIPAKKRVDHAGLA